MQLLALREFDIDFLRFGLSNKQLRRNNLAALCGVLRELVTQLPDTIIFCIMDGVPRFETEQWRSQMQELMRLLTLLAEGVILGAVFKLLVTSPGVSKDAKSRRYHRSVISGLQRMRLKTNQWHLTARDPHRETYRMLPSPRPLGYSNQFLIHDSDAIDDADNIFEHGCE